MPLLAALACLLFAPLLLATGRPAATGSYTFTSWAGPALTVWFHAPAGLRAETPVVFVLHGVRRNASEYRDSWVAAADQHGFLLLCPEFDREQFPGGRAYNQGNVRDAAGQDVPVERWSFTAIERIFDDARPRFGVAAGTYGLYGHSAGGQFVHRFLWFMPGARVERAVAANAGWYLAPEPEVAFPYGLRDARLPAGAAEAFFARDFFVLLGERDVDPQDDSLTRGPEADRQGLMRFDRGQFFFRTARAYAGERALPFRWQLWTVPGVAHENPRMAAEAAALLRGARPPSAKPAP